MRNPFRRSETVVIDQSGVPTAMAHLAVQLVESDRALANLVQAVDQVRASILVPSGTIARNPIGHDLTVRAPHLQDPRLADAMRAATQVLQDHERNPT